MELEQQGVSVWRMWSIERFSKIRIEKCLWDLAT